MFSKFTSEVNFIAFPHIFSEWNMFSYKNTFELTYILLNKLVVMGFN
jgi:hypothetical protein